MPQDPLYEQLTQLSAAYLRLRAIIPGAFDTPTAPTADQIWDTTERAARRLVHAVEACNHVMERRL